MSVLPLKAHILPYPNDVCFVLSPFYSIVCCHEKRLRQKQSGSVLAQKLNASESAPTKMRLRAQMASRLNQLRDTNLRTR